MHSANNTWDIKARPRTPRSFHQWTRVSVAQPRHVHHTFKLVTATEPVIEPHAYVASRPVETVNTGKPGNAETNAQGNVTGPHAAVLKHKGTPIIGNRSHAPAHLTQIKRVTRYPTHELIFGHIVCTNTVDISSFYFRAAGRHCLHTHEMTMNDQPTKHFRHLVEGA